MRNPGIDFDSQCGIENHIINHIHVVEISDLRPFSIVASFNTKHLYWLLSFSIYIIAYFGKFVKWQNKKILEKFFVI
jgi:hypothetical protein